VSTSATLRAIRSADSSATWRDAETHASEYTGTGETHVVLVEVKEQGKPNP